MKWMGRIGVMPLGLVEVAVAALTACSGGAVHNSVAPTPVPSPVVSRFVMAGTVNEVAPKSTILPGVRIQVTSGPDKGATVTSDAGGLFRFPALTLADISIEASKEGYFPWRVSNLMLDRDRRFEVVLYPMPPRNAAGVPATARCNDASWSWAMTRDEACARQGGVAYAVCPGPLCEQMF